VHRVRGQLRGRRADHRAIRTDWRPTDQLHVRIVNAPAITSSEHEIPRREFSQAWPKPRSGDSAEAIRRSTSPCGDSAQKLAILASISFGWEIAMEDVFVEGIDGIAKEDLRYGREMGYRLKLLAIAQRSADGRLSLRVHPSFISAETALARVDGSINALSVFGSAVGETLYYDEGRHDAHRQCVMADLIDVALGNSRRPSTSCGCVPRGDQAVHRADWGSSPVLHPRDGQDEPSRGGSLRQTPARPPDQHLRRLH
jgi:hypothetical protein